MVHDAKLGQKVSTLLWALQTAPAVGEVWECGVHRGSSARWLGFMVSEQVYTRGYNRVLRLFDTFTGLPPRAPQDSGGSATQFDNTSAELVRQLCPWECVALHAGLIPDTFAGLEASTIAFAHVDLDLYQSTLDALEFILPRLVPRGAILIDDFDEPVMWPGVTCAVEQILPRAGYEMERPLHHMLVVRRAA